MQPIDRSSGIAFGLNPLNRLSDKRPDAGFVEASRHHPSTRFLLLAQHTPILKQTISATGAQVLDPFFTAKEWEGLSEVLKVNPSVTSSLTAEAIFLGSMLTAPHAAPHAGSDAESDATVAPTGEGAANADGLAEGASLFAIGLNIPPHIIASTHHVPKRDAAASTASESVPDIAAPLRPEWLATDLRTLAMAQSVSATTLGEMASAKSVLHWHSRHQYCANCGTPTAVSAGGWRRDCSACNAQHFPRVDPVVIMLLIDGERCVLGRQPQFAAGMYSALAGFLEPGETVEDAVRRELYEEAGVACSTVSYFASQPWPFPSSLMIGCFGRAMQTDLTVDQNELEDARWFSREEVALMLAGTHPEGFSAPKPYAIAHHLLQHFVLHGADVLKA